MRVYLGAAPAFKAPIRTAGKYGTEKFVYTLLPKSYGKISPDQTSDPVSVLQWESVFHIFRHRGSAARCTMHREATDSFKFFRLEKKVIFRLWLRQDRIKKWGEFLERRKSSGEGWIWHDQLIMVVFPCVDKRAANLFRPNLSRPKILFGRTTFEKLVADGVVDFFHPFNQLNTVTHTAKGLLFIDCLASIAIFLWDLGLHKHHRSAHCSFPTIFLYYFWHFFECTILYGY